MNHRTLALLLTVCAMAACAEGSVEPGDSDAGNATTSGPDVTFPDVRGLNVNPGTDSGGPNIAANNPTSICIVNETTCLDATTRGTCRPDQMGFDAEPCGEGRVCDNGSCIDGVACEPGSTSCFDSQTVIRCRQSGAGYIQMTCEAPLNCGDGMCTDKLPWGSGCTTDDECASGNCRCGSGTDETCPASIGSGICANTSCQADGCGIAADCLASDQVPISDADYDHCVRACDTQNPCPTGSKCVAVPVRRNGGVELRESCFFTGIKAFGDDCTTDGECLTGACLLDYFNSGFCSRRCDDDGICSQGSACVALIPGEFWCSPLCGDGSIASSDPCPMDEPVDRFDVTCKNLMTQDNDVTRVCATP